MKFLEVLALVAPILATAVPSSAAIKYRCSPTDTPTVRKTKLDELNKLLKQSLLRINEMDKTDDYGAMEDYENADFELTMCDHPRNKLQAGKKPVVVVKKPTGKKEAKNTIKKPKKTTKKAKTPVKKAKTPVKKGKKPVNKVAKKPIKKAKKPIKKVVKKPIKKVVKKPIKKNVKKPVKKVIKKKIVQKL